MLGGGTLGGGAATGSGGASSGGSTTGLVWPLDGGGAEGGAGAGGGARPISDSGDGWPSAGEARSHSAKSGARIGRLRMRPSLPASSALCEAGGGVRRHLPARSWAGR